MLTAAAASLALIPIARDVPKLSDTAISNFVEID
jgi:hypothetical protein